MGGDTDTNSVNSTNSGSSDSCCSCSKDLIVGFLNCWNASGAGWDRSSGCGGTADEV